ncbi:MAG: transposase [Candidatus Parcubacteria bacterium]|nr:transposase [Candidatus Parcubacteria bacterium]
MPRLPRVDIGGEIYHVINRANARLPIFFEEDDFKLFETILEEAKQKYKMRILAYCLMPNHFHLVLYPYLDGDLQKFMQWITLTHTQRWHTKNKTVGTGHLYQGRYKSFGIEGDDHLLTVIRYVERNPLRAKLVTKAQNWDFSSLNKRLKNKQTDLLSPWPIAEPKDYISFVNLPQTCEEEESVRYSVNRGKPFGTPEWTNEMINRHGLLATIRKRGRQNKGT